MSAPLGNMIQKPDKYPIDDIVMYSTYAIVTPGFTIFKMRQTTGRCYDRLKIHLCHRTVDKHSPASQYEEQVIKSGETAGK